MEKQRNEGTPLREIDQITIAETPFIVKESRDESGRVRLYFLGRNESIKKKGDLFSREIARISYRIFGEEAMFLGLAVPPQYAGLHMGKALFEYFEQHLQAQGLSLGKETAVINKPLIAKMLVALGFEPVSKNVLVEILPESKYAQSRVPNVAVVQNAQQATLRSAADGGAFYRVVDDPVEVARRYPLTPEKNIVAVQTRYAKKRG